VLGAKLNLYSISKPLTKDGQEDVPEVTKGILENIFYAVCNWNEFILRSIK
jgi:hypothetical protein